MAAHDDLVAVYYFRTAPSESEAPVMSAFKATREAIKTHFDGVVLEGTEELVAPDAIDDVGRYVNAPSAWTDLA